MKITLYHGSTLSIEHPLAKVGRADLDFGRGFYLTSLLAVSYTHLTLPTILLV